MMTREQVNRLKRSVWQTDAVRPVRIYAVLDGARDPAIHHLVERSYREKSCLFAGTLAPELVRTAPFLLELQPGDSVTDQILLRGWTDAWGILVRTESSFRSLRRHLRTFLRVKTESGQFLLFRYYDPRVLTAYLLTCTAEELALIFGEDILAITCFSNLQAASMTYSFNRGELSVQLQELEPLAVS